MPLFIGISGYLFNFEKLQDSHLEYSNIIFKRILLTYIVANIFYCFFLHYKILLSLDFISFIKSSLKTVTLSYYHLWYIQGYFSYVLITYILTLCKLKPRYILIISILISVFVYYLYFFIKRNTFDFNMKVFLNNFRLYNLIFFICGYLIKQYHTFLTNNKINFFIFVSLFLTNTVLLFFWRNNIVQCIVFYISNVFAIWYLISLCVHYPKFKVPILNNYGINSLYIYLYHIAIVVLLKKSIPNHTIYYIVSLIIIALSMILNNYLVNKKILEK